MSTHDGHKAYFSGEEDRHEYGVGFLVHRHSECCLRMQTGLQQTVINITVIQVYAPTSSHDDSEVDHFYQQLQETIDKAPKKDILVVQGD